MSYLAHEIEDLKKSRGMTAADIAKRSEVDPAALSRVKKGERNITFDELRLICRKFPDEAPKLLRARLLDECDGPGGERLEIGIRTEGRHLTMTDSPTPYVIPLPPGVDEAWQKIKAYVGSDSKLRNTILFIGERLPALPNSGGDKSGKGHGDTERLDKDATDSTKRGRKNDPGQK